LSKHSLVQIKDEPVIARLNLLGVLPFLTCRISYLVIRLRLRLATIPEWRGFRNCDQRARQATALTHLLSSIRKGRRGR
jgi:hypothetical protein